MYSHGFYTYRISIHHLYTIIIIKKIGRAHHEHGGLVDLQR